MKIAITQTSVNAGGSVNKGTIDIETLNNALARMLNISDQDMEELRGLPLEEKKRILRQRNAELEEAVQDQEDNELRELLERQEQLKRKLSYASEKGHKTGHKGKTSNKRVEKSNINKRENSIPRNSMQKIPVLLDSEADNEYTCMKKLPELNEIKDLLHMTDRKVKRKERKSKRRRGRKYRRKYKSSSESSDSETSSSSGSESEGDTDSEAETKKVKKGKKVCSGIYAKPCNSEIVSGELFAHSALDDEIGGHRELNKLSFNLLVAGELEIISNKLISKDERNTCIEVLKKLAYKAEYLTCDEIIRQYTNFVHKVERGKFRWGSKSDLRTFEQQLVYCISIEHRKNVRKSSKFNEKLQDHTKYCLDFNRGSCKFNQGHEGKLHGQTVFKAHICKACLVRENREVPHAEKDCPGKK